MQSQRPRSGLPDAYAASRGPVRSHSFLASRTAPFLATIQSVAPLRMRAFASTVSTLVGLALGPLLVGVLADGFASRFGDDALRYSPLAPTCAPLLSVVVSAIGARCVAGDLRRARASDG